MESEKAYKGLLFLTKKYKFNELHSHIKNIGPLKIKLRTTNLYKGRRCDLGKSRKNLKGKAA